MMDTFTYMNLNGRAFTSLKRIGFKDEDYTGKHRNIKDLDIIERMCKLYHAGGCAMSEYTLRSSLGPDERSKL